MIPAEVLAYALKCASVHARLAARSIPGVDHDDLAQEGMIRLLRDWPAFDPAESSERTFADARVRYGVLDAARVARRASRAIVQRVAAGGDGSTSSSAAGSGITPLQARAALSLARPVSLTPPPGYRNGDDGGGWCDRGRADEGLPSVDRKDEVLAAFARVHRMAPNRRVGERRALVLALAYFEALTFAEIALVMSLSESRVCQLHEKALETLRPEGVRREPKQRFGRGRPRRERVFGARLG